MKNIGYIRYNGKSYKIIKVKGNYALAKSGEVFTMYNVEIYLCHGDYTDFFKN